MPQIDAPPMGLDSLPAQFLSDDQLISSPEPGIAEIVLRSGDLERGDTTIREGQYADTFNFQSEGGERIQVMLSSHDFDTFLLFTTPSGEVFENDDALGTEWSMIRAPMVEAGTYQVTVTSFSPEETGHYEVNVKREQCDVRFEQGVLQPNDETVYDIEGQAGQRVDITLTSEDFDTAIRIRSLDGFVDGNDDGFVYMESTDSRLTTVLPVDGEYQIEVLSSDNRGGEFELTIELGGRCHLFAHGELTEAEGKRDTFDVEVGRGEYFDISAQSSELDTLITVDTPGGEQWGCDDFGEYTSNSFLRCYAREAGTYKVTVTSAFGSETGRYSIIVERPRLGRNRN